MKLISVVTPCFNEEDNIEILYNEVKKQFDSLPQYSYEHIFIDNASNDRTIVILRRIAETDKNVKIIINSRNFGHIRSPYYALLQAKGAAVISMVSDLQDPPVLIPEMLKKWEEGYKIVAGVKQQSEENWIFFRIRKAYYNVVSRLSEIDLLKNFTGFGLYDQCVIEVLRGINDNYPYFRGLICDIGFEKAIIEYVQPARKKGITKNNFFTLYDIGMLGITSHSKVPLRLATMAGFGMAMFSFLVALVYLILKLIFWNEMSMGIAPLVIGLFFFSSIQLFFIGIIGEYIGNIHTHLLNRPLVVEKERINFSKDENNETNK
jgi:polyisoprenyl-phosphate glycosyltransferase